MSGSESINFGGRVQISIGHEQAKVFTITKQDAQSSNTVMSGPLHERV
jgi:hypothetical protein